MIRSGLVSITLRQQSTAVVIDTVAEAGLQGIEWGGDVHVPHGDLKTAEAVGEATRGAGIEVAAYGSYYRCEAPDGKGAPEPKAVLDSAEALGAPSIRIWAGQETWEQMGRSDRIAVMRRMETFVEQAAERGLLVALEYHRNTLTQSEEGVRQVLKGIQHPQLKTLWQPMPGADIAENLRRLEAVLPRLLNVHVFQWGPGGFQDRRPLEEGRDEWSRYFSLANSEDSERWALIEFVRDDLPRNVIEDGRELLRWL
ncbi:MAG: sugar phosphate isomerase/epimerase [Opitutales bacterium]|nr:sugar phosphate isomerase/epimerase [Opitutales bacterium]